MAEAARLTDGFSMAYVQEVIVNALLICAHAGTDADDAALLASVETLRLQRKHALRDDEGVADREPVGFYR